jgi:hypothetical protein
MNETASDVHGKANEAAPNHESLVLNQLELM